MFGSCRRRRGPPRPLRVLLLALLLAALPLACGPEASGPDLPEIRERGTLRLLRVAEPEAEHLPRRGWPPDRERAHATAFAHELGLDVEWVTVERWKELLPALREGRGDLVADNVTVTEARRERVAFSAPYALVREQVVARAGDGKAIEGPEDLAGRSVAARRSSSYWATLERLREEHGDLELVPVPPEQSVDETLHRVAVGDYDLTLADSNLVAQVLAYRDDLEVALSLDRNVVIAWALRPGATELRRAVDAYLERMGNGRPEEASHTQDLPGIRKRGTLRVLTRNNASTYYVSRGQLVGFEYEIAAEFARRNDLRVEMVVPPSRADLFEWLRQGRGDVVAAGITATPERADRESVVFSRPYHEVREVVVARAGERGLDSIEDLEGRTLAVRPGSHYWTTLTHLRDEEGVGLELRAAPEELETEEIIARVAEGEYDLTLADSHILAIELAWRDDVRGAFPVGDPVRHGWAMRPGNPELRSAVDAFFREEYRGTFMNVLVRRYFESEKRIRGEVARRPAREGALTPWDDVLRRVGDRYGYDWRLLAAQMHQESRFDPKARSNAGAVGLMQILPRTAAELGVEDPDALTEPETNIEAGARYLAWTRDRIESSVPGPERRWLALAAYNVGWGHVSDARRLAGRRGLDPARWFGNVEEAMLLKRRPSIAEHTRFGYCRCGEPVHYVRAIRDRYRAYLQAVAAGGPAAPSSR